jgi:hypothetical protein
MVELLSSNREAANLALELWNHFEFRIYFSLRSNDGKPARVRRFGVEATGCQNFGVCISVPRTERQEEALVHELLHVNLFREGYPMIWIDECDDGIWELGGGIINNAEHVPMLPTFLKLGYAENRFLGPGRPTTENEEKVFNDIDSMSPRLIAPNSYLEALSVYLRRHEIPFRPLFHRGK